MMNPLHILKTDSDTFQLSWDGIKNYEIRCNDRDYKVGEFITLRETVYTGKNMILGFPLEYTGRELPLEVTHVLKGYGLMESWVILSVKRI